MSKQKTQWMLFAMGAALFVWLMARLFAMRFETGDVYPEYSSLRADPLGTMAFYESLERAENFRVERNLRPFDKLRETEGKTLFLLGSDVLDFRFMPDDDLKDLSAFVINGGRLVVAFRSELATDRLMDKRADERRRQMERRSDDGIFPDDDNTSNTKDKKAKRKTTIDKATSSPSTTTTQSTSFTLTASALSTSSIAIESTSSTATGSTSSTISTSSIISTSSTQSTTSTLAEDQDAPSWASALDRWGLEDEYLAIPLEKTGPAGDMIAGVVEAHRTTEPAALELPTTLPWHSALTLKSTSPAWRALYARGVNGQYPVVLERTFGKGSMVFVSDTYLLSNEAMQKDRHTPLLAWLMGPNTRALFDETHLGVAEEPGVMTLARRYRLHGAVAAMLALAILFVWRNASSLVPPLDDDDLGFNATSPSANSTSAASVDAKQALVNLLKHNVPHERLPELFIEEWKRTIDMTRTSAQSKLKQMEETLKRSQECNENPLAVFKQLRTIANQKNR